MIEKIEVQSSQTKYPIILGRNVRFKLSEYVPFDSYDRIIVVTDENVEKLYLDDYLSSLSAYDPLVYVTEASESVKSIESFYNIQTYLMKNDITRRSLLLALGGGVIGDLAGFAAATYKRGIDFIYLPTTLLAHDSSIGGKVAINLEDAKNIIGQFYPPKRVIFDLETFQTLPDEEKRSGLAEMVKHGLIKDVQLFDQLLTQIDDEMDLTDDDFKRLLKRSILVKRAIIEKDEFEVGERQFLNFGHTLGHAIELLERSKQITHGESVMIGMHFALWLSEVVNGSRLPIESLASFAVKLNYPTDRLHVSADDLITAMKRDKKNVASNINMVLIEELGRPHVHSFKFEELKQHLTRFLDRWNKGDFIESINE